MAVRYFRGNSDNVLRFATEVDTENPPAGFNAVTKATIAAVYAGPIFMGGTWDGSIYTPPANQPGHLTAQIKLQFDLSHIHEAYQNYHQNVRKQGWASIRSGTTPEQGLVATDRWIYHQVALADRIVRAELMATNNQDERDAALAQLLTWVGSNGYTWYTVVLSNAATIVQWASAPVVAGAGIYTDLLEVTGSIGAVRGPDTVFALYPRATIHADFDPEKRLLR